MINIELITHVHHIKNNGKQLMWEKKIFTKLFVLEGTPEILSSFRLRRASLISGTVVETGDACW